MSSSLVFWIVAAVLLFWAVGAYNRLVRMRAEANAAFAVLETELNRQVELVNTCLPPGETQPASLFDGDEPSFWGGLQGAAAQFAASLAAARHKPLDPDGIATLAAAHDILTMAWERAERDDAHDLAGARLPDTVTSQRAHIQVQIRAAAEQFNAAVVRYNEAIGQFPALLLAWLFGFKQGLGLPLKP